jgi:hypothetical protein
MFRKLLHRHKGLELLTALGEGNYWIEVGWEAYFS